MARPVSSKHSKQLTGEWTERLRGHTWQGLGSAKEVRQLISVLGIGESGLSPDFRKRARIAVVELASALSPRTTADSKAYEPDSKLSEWIVRHLLSKGDTLLISETQRIAMLARQRDAARRSNHVDRGLQAKTVEMPAEAWDRLSALRPRLQKAIDKHVSLGMAIERLVNAYDGGVKFKPDRSKRRGLALPPHPPQDLFK